MTIPPSNPRTLPSKAGALLGLSLLAAAGASCELVNSAGSTVVVAGALVKSPPIEVPDRLSIRSETVATVWLGQRVSATSTDEPAPITGASVSLVFAGNEVKLGERSEREGLYAETSTDNPALEYVEGAAYTFAAELPGEPGVRYGGTVRMTPAALTPAAMVLDPAPVEVIEGLEDAGIHERGAALTVRWGRQYGRYAYVSVWRATPDRPEEPTLVFDNRPETANDIIQLIAGNPAPEITIPGETFGEDGLYAVLLVTMDKADDLEPNTFLGSPILAGSGAVAFLAVGNVL